MSDILISPAQLQDALAREPWLIFDVRHDLADHEAGRRAFVQGHIPGAIYLDHEKQLSAPRTGRNGRHPLPRLDDLTALMHALGLRPDSRVVVYDASGGMFAAHVWWMLRWMGHEHVAVLDGGWQAWLDAGGQVEAGKTQDGPYASMPDSTSSQAGHAAFHGTGDKTPEGAQSADAAGGEPNQRPIESMPTVDANTVKANLNDPVFTIVDARAPERFRGEVEPMDPVAGHIPGALNRPNSQNLQASGRFKPSAQLREEFTALLGGRSPEQVVHQCGSGITACHNLFAMELAGLSGSALYPGSWSEWCSDPARPVATGD
ncbi:sulfurtransferase [Pusillimonas sp.]|uniref:sulfurtransferase n=1 Tax=Pusillimonas sp. TaxID=3040095 RepID=UPI0037C91A45